jgi:ribosomal protein L11 methylase PrmA
MIFPLLMHIHLHAKTQKKYESRGSASRNIRIRRSNLVALVDSLIAAVSKLSLKRQKTEWGEYYSFTNYTDRSFEHKKEIIAGFLKNVDPGTLWDLGANTGEFARVAGDLGFRCIAFDIDPVAVEKHYRYIKEHNITNILPLIMDLTNPSPSIGWNNGERMSIRQRQLPGAILALALVHHLAISNNLPFPMIAGFLGELCHDLVIEFVPKSDSQVKKLLESRKDVFPRYDQENFEKEFSVFFNIIAREKISESERVLYWMKRK